MAKKLGSDKALSGVAARIQAMGANGLCADYPLARHLSAAKLLAYTDGTTEMMNERIGHLLPKQFTRMAAGEHRRPRAQAIAPDGDAAVSLNGRTRFQGRKRVVKTGWMWRGIKIEATAT